MAVVTTVAAVSDTEPSGLEPLHRVVDPDALDAIFQPGSAACVTFPYNGYEVVVYGGGEIQVTPHDG